MPYNQSGNRSGQYGKNYMRVEYRGSQGIEAELVVEMALFLKEQ